ncbi:RNA polymerase sigma-70 factor [Streptomyces sp. WSLK1-5]|uniref:RNA polymerase sigma-70 factor n=1 Tax=unclassified Streptomyces TaxID=2593676 RepID=UPI0037BCA9AD
MYPEAFPTEAPPADRSLAEAVTTFVELRPRLFGIAYRVLGSATEAEDVVQEAWLRWQRTDRSAVHSPAAFLSSTTTRLAINVAQSARVRRETYIGPWLPEPIDTSLDAVAGAERAEALELALLLVLQKLTPTERAAYVLREAFEYGYSEIAEILRLTPVNARKIVSRARKHLTDEERDSVDVQEHRRLLDAFVAAAQEGDVASLEALLTPDAVSLSDGNGLRGAARVPVVGRARVANLSTAASRFWPTVEIAPVQANGRAGVLLHRDGRPATFMTIAATRRGIHRVLWVFAPDKIATFLGSRADCAPPPARPVDAVARDLTREGSGSSYAVCRG